MTNATATQRTLLRAEGFTCPSCVNKIEGALNRMPGVETAKVHFNTSRIEVDHDPAAVSPEDIVAAIRNAGYKATPSAF